MLRSYCPAEVQLSDECICAERAADAERVGLLEVQGEGVVRKELCRQANVIGRHWKHD
jgi:hypothetical protein